MMIRNKGGMSLKSVQSCYYIADYELIVSYAITILSVTICQTSVRAQPLFRLSVMMMPMAWLLHYWGKYAQNLIVSLLLLDILQYKNRHSLKFRRLRNNLKKGLNGQQFSLKKLAVRFFIAYICFHKFSQNYDKRIQL